MNKKKFLEDFQKINSPVEIIGELENWNKKVECKCLLCNDIFYITPTNLKRGSIHRECSYILRGKNKRITYGKFIENLKNINENIEVIGLYQKAIIPIKVKCKVCGNIWEATPNNLLRGHGCPNCYYTNKCGKMPEEKLNEYIEEIYSKIDDLILLNKPKQVYGDWLCKCKNCGNEWKSNLNNLLHLNNNKSCPYCNGRMLDIEKFKAVLKDKNFTVNNIPTKFLENIKCHCNKCGYEWNTKPTNILKIKGCPKCLNPKRKSHKEFLKDLEDRNIQVELLSPYINYTTKIKRKCLMCEDISEMLPCDILNGCCKGCYKDKMRKHFAMPHEVFCDKFYSKYGKNYKILSNYVNTKTKIDVKHKICGETFSFLPSNMQNPSTCICPCCYNKNSNGERFLQKYFYENNIEYEIHKTFDDLKGVKNGHLSYDFYLKDKNLLIEYQGIQHYQPVKVFGGNEKFAIQQEHDKRKRHYATNNNIKLLEIPYWEYDNITVILANEL